MIAHRRLPEPESGPGDEGVIVRRFAATNDQRPDPRSGIVHAMNFLAHLWLAGDDEGLRLGAMLGDFIRGTPEGLAESGDIPAAVHRGILLHRFIDQYVDGLPEVARLREDFPSPFRRYSGIILDLAFDHELARRWDEYSTVPLETFDRNVRDMLARRTDLVPADLERFMRYADRRGLFAAYRDEQEIMHSLRGIGHRLSRPNPLHRVSEIWPELRAGIGAGFDTVFALVRLGVVEWLGEEEPTQRTAQA